MITLTQAAADKLKEIMDKQSIPLESRYLRIKVMGGGCSGFQYELVFDEIKKADGTKKTDMVFEHHDVKVVCDPKSYIYLNGAEVDYTEGLTGSGFVFKNPNVKGSCGCGSSFHT